MKRYKARPGKKLRVGLQIVTDDSTGVELTNSPTVREHARLGRLLVVEAKPEAEQASEPAAVEQKPESDAVEPESESKPEPKPESEQKPEPAATEAKPEQKPEVGAAKPKPTAEQPKKATRRPRRSNGGK